MFSQYLLAAACSVSTSIIIGIILLLIMSPGMPWSVTSRAQPTCAHSVILKVVIAVSYVVIAVHYQLCTIALTM